MLEKEVTRKQFIFSILSVVALLSVSSLPKALVNKVSKAKGSTNTSTAYGNQAYGGVRNA